MKTAILAILLFCIMIFPHELGHFIAAKRLGVKVNEFAFGMGPTIWKKQRRCTASGFSHRRILRMEGRTRIR
ncbi:MAG: site-2 protease family protein [Anaerovoracaceae bacterium]